MSIIWFYDSRLISIERSRSIMPTSILSRKFPGGDSMTFRRRIEILHPLLLSSKNISPFAKLGSNEVYFWFSFPSEVIQLRYRRESSENHSELLIVKMKTDNFILLRKPLQLQDNMQAHAIVFINKFGNIRYNILLPNLLNIAIT